jgi:hypothetical protein
MSDDARQKPVLSERTLRQAQGERVEGPSRSIRTEQIQPLSAHAELLVLLRAAMAISAGVGIYVALTIGGGATSVQRNLLPFQKLIADRPPDEQRMFRELQEGLLEAEALRSATRAWPATPALADAGIPPFAADPTRRTDYDWRLLQAGTLVNYLGLPRRGDAPAWLLVVQEPEPGVPPDQNFEDQEHHRLLDGTMLHVATWVRPDPRGAADRATRMPQAEGWTQLYAVGPAATGPNLPGQP